MISLGTIHIKAKTLKCNLEEKFLLIKRKEHGHSDFINELLCIPLSGNLCNIRTLIDSISEFIRF